MIKHLTTSLTRHVMDTTAATLAATSSLSLNDTPPPPQSKSLTPKTMMSADDTFPISIKILTSETREVDELDNKPFTMYILEVTQEKKTLSTLQRRYSQFFELKNATSKTTTTKNANNKFPPKQLLNKLNPKTVKLRTAQLESWMNTILQQTPTLEPILSFLEVGKSSEISAPGAVAPNLNIMDIHGRQFASSDHPNSLIIYAAASRYNFQALEKFIKPSMETIVRNNPNLNCTIVSVADLRVVPKEALAMVRPILEKVDAKNATISINNYSSTHPKTFDGFETFFVPDFSPSGDILQLIGCSDANWTFRVFMVSGGKVIGSVQSNTPDISDRCTDIMKAAIGANGNVVKGFEHGAGSLLKQGEVVVKARSKESITVTAADGGGGFGGKTVGIEFWVSSNNVVFSLLGSGGEIILPKRVIECGEGKSYKKKLSFEEGVDVGLELKFKNAGKCGRRR